ncbi:MAG TPA: hypothetical protein VGF71_09245 [Caulobacteraceae bacterium]
MIATPAQAFTSPAGVLATVVSLLTFALARTPAGPLLAALRLGGGVITASLATAVYAGVAALTAVFNI